MEKNKHLEIKKLTIAAILLAIIFLFAFTPLGFLRIGVIEITFLMIPVAIGACVLGWKYGMFLGFMFGIASLLQALTGASAFGDLLMGINPIFTVVICIVPRTLMGLCTSLLFSAVSKVDKTGIIPYMVGTISGAFFNTLFFIGSFLLLFGNADLEMLADGPWAFIVTLVLANSLCEIACCAVVGTAVAKPLSKVVAEKNKV